MRKFAKNIKIGTKVKLFGVDEILQVKEIHKNRLWIKVEKYEGSFQRKDVQNFTNKG